MYPYIYIYSHIYIICAHYKCVCTMNIINIVCELVRGCKSLFKCEGQEVVLKTCGKYARLSTMVMGNA